MNTNKRQKVPNSRYAQYGELPQNPETFSFTDRNNHGYTLDTLPAEVLEIILRLLPFHEVANSVRLVSRHCSTVAATVLNGAFMNIGTRVENLDKRLESVTRKTKNDSELFTHTKALNSLQLVKAQYKMLRAVTWRYTHPPMRQKRFPRLCFYAGALLDSLNELLDRIARCHGSVIGPGTVNSSITSFVAVCKRFMNFFEKVSERKVNRSTLISGCKVVDILDCLVEGREVLYFKTASCEKGVVHMKLRYTMKRAWFTCLEVSKNSEEDSWRDKQRFMYLRLRRLVSSVNEHLFENLHYERELSLQIPSIISLKPPPASTYSGYGEYGGQFFYYGNMNKYAYENKFTHAMNTLNITSNTEQIERSPSFDLVFEIKLKCTPEIAPLAVRTILRTDQFDVYEKKTYNEQQLYLRMNITCPASMSNRLPGNFVWELRSPRSTR